MMKSTCASLLFLYYITFMSAYADANIAERQSSNATDCSVLELVIARGTGEPLDPSFGKVVGDPLFEATEKLISGVTGYSVNYPATSTCDSRSIGVNDTITHLSNKSQQCPGQKFVLVGYSQGAEVMHLAGTFIPPSLYPQIIALVMFGDPGNKGPNAPDLLGTPLPAFPVPLAQKLKENCALGDPLCSDGANIEAHLSYNSPGTTYISDSAAYIQKQLQTDGNAGPDPSPNGAGTGNATANASALSGLDSLLGVTASATCPSSPTGTFASAATSSAAMGSSGTVSPGATTAGASSMVHTGGAGRAQVFFQFW